MANFTSNTYQMKRKILTFTNKISRQLTKPERKFVADITYGILAAESCLLTDIVDQLHEDSKKINIVDRLSRHLEKGTPVKAAVSYLQKLLSQKRVPKRLSRYRSLCSYHQQSPCQHFFKNTFF